VTLDDSVLEYALYDLLGEFAQTDEPSISIEQLRDQWPATGLRGSDLMPAIEMLIDAGSLAPVAGTVGATAWSLTRKGYSRAIEVVSVAPATMADEVARSVLKLIRDRMAPSVVMPRIVWIRRRSGLARDRANDLLARRSR